MNVKEFKTLGTEAGLHEHPKSVLQGIYKGYFTYVQHLTANSGVYLTVTGISGEEAVDPETTQRFLDQIRTTRAWKPVI